MRKIHSNKKVQLALGLLFGIVFGFLLQKGGATKYDVIIGQLLFTDYTVVKIMLSAVLVGMLGVHTLRSFGVIDFTTKPGSIGQTVIGGLIFGVGFGLLGYCPGTLMGAIGEGALDAGIGGIFGIILGSWIFAIIYPKISSNILAWGDFGNKTLPEILNVNRWYIVVPMSLAIISFLYFLYINNL